MEFGPVPLEEAEGAILAHSLAAGARRLPKGRVLTAEDVAALRAAGFERVTVGRFGPGDMGEDAAAEALGARFAGPGLRLTAPVSGRVNVVAEAAGLLRVDRAAIDAFNAVDEAITVATLPDWARVSPGALVATVKIIPYAAPRAAVEQAARALGAGALALHPFRPQPASLILTRTPGMKESLLAKGEAATRARLASLGLELAEAEVVRHEEAALAERLAARAGRMTLVLGGSATSDRRDVIPAAIEDAGGEIIRFGMPVDPGNLLVLGRLGGAPVVGLPGCARAPALNGADWVLERLAAGFEIGGEDIARMGVGGLLKEVPARGKPRRATAPRGARPHVLLLAAGRSSRMGGDHKLLREVDGQPLVRRTLARLEKAGFPIHVVVDPANAALVEALEGCGHEIVPAPDAAQGLSASLRAGLAALPEDAPAVIVALADMPEIDARHLQQLAAAHDPESGALIVAPVAPNGKRGNPVLFDRRYFEPLAQLTGDRGARALIDAEADAVVTVPADAGVLVDLDTPEAWADWESRRAR